MRGSLLVATEIRSSPAAGLLTSVATTGVAPAESERVEAHARRRLLTVSTPVGLWVGATSVVLALALVGLVGLRSVAHRQAALATVADDATPMVVSAVDLYVALAAADAAASTSFIRPGPESADLRARYLAEIARAQHELTTLSQAPGLSGPSESAVADILDRLISYTGRIEIARTHDRLDNTVGFAYQRSASQVMRDELLPAATTIYREAAERLDRGLREGRAPWAETLFVGVAVVGVLTIVAVHVFVTQRTRRWLNVGLLGALLLLVVATFWVGSGLAAQRNTFGRAQREGSDPLLVHSVARILALRSMSDENLDLIERGTDAATMANFDTMIARIGGDDGRSGLLFEARRAAPDVQVSERVASITALYLEYLAGHERVRDAADRGDYDAAIELAVGEQAAASAALDAALSDEVDRVRSELASASDEASDRLRVMPVALVSAVLLACGAALAGLWPRLREYR